MFVETWRQTVVFVFMFARNGEPKVNTLLNHNDIEDSRGSEMLRLNAHLVNEVSSVVLPELDREAVLKSSPPLNLRGRK